MCQRARLTRREELVQQVLLERHRGVRDRGRGELGYAHQRSLQPPRLLRHGGGASVGLGRQRRQQRFAPEAVGPASRRVSHRSQPLLGGIIRRLVHSLEEQGCGPFGGCVGREDTRDGLCGCAPRAPVPFGEGPRGQRRLERLSHDVGGDAGEQPEEPRARHHEAPDELAVVAYPRARPRLAAHVGAGAVKVLGGLHQRVGATLRSPPAASLGDAVAQTEVGDDRGERAGLGRQRRGHHGCARALEALEPRDHQQHARGGHPDNLEIPEEARHAIGREPGHLRVVKPRVHQKQQQRVGHQTVTPVQRGGGRLVALVSLHRVQRRRRRRRVFLRRRHHPEDQLPGGAQIGVERVGIVLRVTQVRPAEPNGDGEEQFVHAGLRLLAVVMRRPEERRGDGPEMRRVRP